MEFYSASSEQIMNAIQPIEIKDLWNKIHSYIYVISKFMPIKDSEKPQTLYKVGISRTRRDGNRLGGDAKTFLINFKVHRIYLYEYYQLEKGKKDTDYTYAEFVEGKLRQELAKKFTRVMFDNQNPSEYFSIGKKKESDFLKSIDDLVYKDISPRPMYSTKFLKDGGSPLIMKGLKPIIVGIKNIDGKFIEKDSSRKTESILGSNTRMKAADKRRADELAKTKEKDREERATLAKTKDFWINLFVNREFKDPDISKKVLVFKDVVSSKAFNQFVVLFEAKYNPKKLSQFEIDQLDSSGFLTVNDALDVLNLKSQYKESYDYYTRKNSERPVD